MPTSPAPSSPPAAPRRWCVGVGDGEMFVGSDVAAFIEHTRDAVELGQDQAVVITADGYRITDFDGNDDVDSAATFHIDWDLSAAEKGGYEYFMLKEIAEQPAAVADTLLGHFVDGRIVLDEQRLSDQELREIDKVFVVACGTAYHSGLLAKYAIEHWTRLPVEVELASEFRYRDPVLDRSTLVVAISQSGETADTLEAVRHAKEQKAKVLAICNTNGSQIPRECRRGALHPRRPGDRRGVHQDVPGADRRQLPRRPGAGAGPRHQVPRRGRARVPRAGGHAGPGGAGARRRSNRSPTLARRFAQSPTVLFLGRHVGYPVALEGALKLKELAYMHAEGFAAGELKHGPIALIEDGLPVIVVMPSPKGSAVLHAKLLSNIREIQARGAITIVIAEEGDDTVRPYADHLIEIPAVLNAFPAAAVDDSAAGVRRVGGAGPRLRRRQAAQPRQVRHRRIGSAPCAVWSRAGSRWITFPPRKAFPAVSGGDGRVEQGAEHANDGHEVEHGRSSRSRPRGIRCDGCALYPQQCGPPQAESPLSATRPR